MLYFATMTARLPSGTVTFLFTDIEGSTKLAREHPDAWDALRERHHAILQSAIESHSGYVFQIIGDAFCAAFHTAHDGLHAVVEAQRNLHTENWGVAAIKDRMGIHTGEAELQANGDYRGYLALSHVQRLMSAGHGGQVLISLATQELIRDDLPYGLMLRDMGERQLKDLIRLEHIYQLVIPNLPGEFPPLKTLDVQRHNLPAQMTSFIGREKEVEEIIKLLGKHRLVTLTGAGGVGKTRLAIQSSTKLVKKFKDGVWWIELVGLSDPSLVPQTIAKAVNVREVPNQPLVETLVGNLYLKQMLLVIDNCEHLISACAQIADRLLGSCKNLKILATSREALDILGETVWHAPSLSLPERHESLAIKALNNFESVHLFTDRAMSVQSRFELTEQNADGVVQICNRLSGMPLAIELAAARVKMMSVDEIAKRLDDRFDLLTAGSRTALPRHQTLRAAIDWSHGLLAESERILFRRLAVFAGGFTLDAAESVCSQGELKRNEILDLLARLVDKSLVVVDDSSGSSRTRYRLLETIREYALEKLTESEEAATIRNQHFEFFMRWAEAAPGVFGADTVKYYEQIDLELDNIRSTMEWAIETRQALLAIRLVCALFYFWYNHIMQGEWFDRFRRVLSLPEGLERTPERAKALNSLSFFYWAGMTAVNPRQELEEALSIGRELDSDPIIAQSLMNLGRTESVDGNYSKARSLLEESLDIGQRLGDEHKTEIVLTKNFLGDVIWNQGDLKKAAKLYEECVSAFREIQDQNFLAYTVRRLGQFAYRQGEYEKAALLCGESLSLNQGLRDERGIVACVAAFAGIATARGKFVFAARLFGAVESLLDALGIRLLKSDEMEHDHNVAELCEKLDRVTLEKAWAKGKAMTMEQVIVFALEEK